MFRIEIFFRIGKNDKDCVAVTQKHSGEFIYTPVVKNNEACGNDTKNGEICFQAKENLDLYDCTEIGSFDYFLH